MSDLEDTLRRLRGAPVSRPLTPEEKLELYRHLNPSPEQLAAGRAQAAQARQARALTDARRRAANPAVPGELRALNNSMLPGKTMASELEAQGARLETAANTFATGFDEYTPDEAAAAVRQAEAEQMARFAEEHPVRDFRMRALGDVVEARLTGGLGPIASAFSGAMEGAQNSEPGQAVAGALTGAAEGYLIDKLTGGVLSRMGVDPATLRSEVFKSLLETSMGEAADISRDLLRDATARPATPAAPPAAALAPGVPGAVPPRMASTPIAQEMQKAWGSDRSMRRLGINVGPRSAY